MHYLFLWVGLALSVQCSLISAVQERITSFVSDIVVHQDSSLAVTEEITVLSAGEFIRHGIVREFPTRYADFLGAQYVVPFEVVQVLHNGHQTKYSVHDVANGKKIYIGDQSTFLAPGEHTYSIVYTTKRQLGFFADHDELYWNVTGNGWRLPIEKAQATVHLPESVSATSAECYTGFQGERGHDCTHAIQGASATFAATRYFQSYEGLTIVVTWPKGYVLEPTRLEKIGWFLKDNWVILLLFFIFFYVSLLAVRCRLVVRRANKQGVVIPLFYPPAGLTPSDVGYMKRLAWKNTLIAADIVDCAVRGFITIEYKKTFWGRAEYTLAATQKYSDGLGLTARDRVILRSLFSQGRTIALSQDNRAFLEIVLAREKRQCSAAVGQYVKDQSSFLLAAWVLFVLAVLLAIFPVVWGWQTSGAAHILVPFLIGIPLLVIHLGHRAYTSEGRKLQDEIDGFQMYLEAAETERIKIIGTPPTKTPELYETYLPYAMVLGVEEQWSRQFAPIFERLEREGHPYVPLWYHGNHFPSNVFASQFGSSFNSAIASATTPPGRSSGFGGSGGSGGGGGGGGGGGW